MAGQGTRKMVPHFHLLKVIFLTSTEQIYFKTLFTEIQKEIAFDIKDILYYINLKFKDRVSEKYYWTNATLARLKRPNYPNNCHDVDIGLLTKDMSSFSQVQFNFRPDPRVQVEIVMVDRQQSLSRSYKYNKYGSSGARIIILNLTHNSYR